MFFFSSVFIAGFICSVGFISLKYSYDVQKLHIQNELIFYKGHMITVSYYRTKVYILFSVILRTSLWNAWVKFDYFFSSPIIFYMGYTLFIQRLYNSIRVFRELVKSVFRVALWSWPGMYWQKFPNKWQNITRWETCSLTKDQPSRSSLTSCWPSGLRLQPNFLGT